MSENENKSSSSTENEPTDNEQKVAGRRKFLKGAVAASPVLLTIASKPSWAGNCSLSGEMSGNLSNQNAKPCNSEGCKVTYWRDNASLLSPGTNGGWHPEYPPSMLFDQAFESSVPVFPGKTLAQIINFKALMDSGEVFDASNVNTNNCEMFSGKTPKRCQMVLLRLGRQAVAALQNAATGLRFPLSIMGNDVEYPSVIVLFQQTWASGNIIEFRRAKNMLRDLNRLYYCPHI